MIKTAVKTVQ